MKSKEIARQLIHILLGIFLLIFLHYKSRIHLLVFLGFAFMFGLLFINIMTIFPLEILKKWLSIFVRKKERIFAEGSVWYVAGLLLASTIIMEKELLAATIIALSLGDGFATILGIDGKKKLPWNKKKTFRGFLAFFLATLPSVAYLGLIGIPFSLFLAFVESLDFGIDDNFLIPMASALFFVIT